MIKIYQNRDWLYKHYAMRKEPMLAMAREAECSETAIYYWLHKMGISIYDRGNLWCDRDWLWEHYVVRKESLSVMAKEAGCGRVTIYNWLRKKEVPIRSCGEGQFLARRNSVIIIPDLLEFMRGEILGDGSARMMGNRSALYEHSSAYEKYLIWLSGHFDKWGIGQVGRIRGYPDKKTGKIYYHYASKSYPELVPIYKRWYSKRDGKMRKTVPKDLKLTPVMARQWYLGDGGLEHPERKHPSIKLSTYDFDRQSVEYLVKELNALGFKATRRPASNTIGLSVHSVPDFLNWIGPCPISCYDYKWAI